MILKPPTPETRKLYFQFLSFYILHSSYIGIIIKKIFKAFIKTWLYSLFKQLSYFIPLHLVQTKLKKKIIKHK